MAGISSLHRFRVYQTREEYRAAFGNEAPEWDPRKPIKSWLDSNPPDADEDGNVQYLCLAVAADKKTPAVKDGKPYLRSIRISQADAITVNIPPKDFARDTKTVDPGMLSPMASIEVPVPCRALKDDEELAFGFGGMVEVRTKGIPVSEVINGGSSDPALKQLLLEINSKLDILLATSRS